jgi:O-antigen/teichoic acid export membrane protein
MWAAAFGYTALILGFVQGIVLVPLHVKYVAPPLYGSWLASGNILAYLGLFDLGFGDAIKQRISFVYGGRDGKALAPAIGTGMGLMAVLSVLPLLAGIACMGPTTRLLHVATSDQHAFSVSFFMAALATSLSILLSAVSALLAGLQRQFVIGVANTISSLVGIAVTVWGLVHGYGLPAIACGLLVRSLLGLAVGGAYSLRVCGELLPARASWFSALELRNTLRISSWTFLSNLAYTLSYQLDTLVIAATVGTVQATAYALTKKASDIVTMACLRVPSATLPALAHLAGEGNAERATASSLSVIRLTTSIAAIGFGGTILLNRVFVQAWVGRSYFAGPRVSALLGLAAFAGILCSAYNSGMYALGRPALAAKVYMAEGILRAILTIVFCRWAGLAGVAWAGFVALAVISFPLNLWAYCRCFNLHIGREIKHLGIAVLAVTASILPVAILSGWLPDRPWAKFLSASAGYVALAGLAVAAVDRRLREQIRSIIRR